MQRTTKTTTRLSVGIIAGLLALTACGSDGDETPTDTVVVGDSVVPVDSVVPEDSTAPADTTAPADSTAPVDTTEG